MNSDPSKTEGRGESVSFGACVPRLSGLPGPTRTDVRAPRRLGGICGPAGSGLARGHHVPLRPTPVMSLDSTASPSHCTMENLCENSVTVGKEHKALRRELHLQRGEGRGEVTREAGEPCGHRGQAATAPETGPHGCRRERPSGLRLRPALRNLFLSATEVRGVCGAGVARWGWRSP